MGCFILLFMKMNNINMLILKHLRTNARKNFSEISRITGIPVTTVFDNYQKLRKNKVITKHSSFIDFRKIGFFYRNFIFVKSRNKKELLIYLDDHKNVNSVFKISTYNYLIDAVFPTMKEFYSFLEELRNFNIQKLEHHDVIEHIKKEEFLSE
jgi:DNA-binding Lrp family transcriptional regulator